MPSDITPEDFVKSLRSCTAWDQDEMADLLENHAVAIADLIEQLTAENQRLRELLTIITEWRVKMLPPYTYDEEREAGRVLRWKIDEWSTQAHIAQLALKGSDEDG